MRPDVTRCRNPKVLVPVLPCGLLDLLPHVGEVSQPQVRLTDDQIAYVPQGGCKLYLFYALACQGGYRRSNCTRPSNHNNTDQAVS